MNIELYISNTLCDLEKSDLSIRLKRQFFNPTELNTKDAQKSYTLSLPSTPTNDAIFKYANVEETDSKFSIYPDAKLYVNGILILDGKFRLTEITRNSYKGNLGVPAPLTVKDIFGEMKMNEAGEWRINDFKGFESISEYNKKENAECIFPLVLYGLLPKYGSNNILSPKDTFGADTRLGMENFPPSFNCMAMLKKIFDHKKYSLTGSALNDEKLNRLYVSYKNPNDHNPNWAVNDIRVSGQWSFLKKGDDEKVVHESRYKINEGRKLCATNIFDSTIMPTLNVNEEGKDCIRDFNGKKIIIPQSGLYKINFTCKYTMPEDLKTVIGSSLYIKSGTLNDGTTEIHLVRNRKVELSHMNWNNKYTHENMEQDIDSDTAIFPKENCVNFIDPNMNSSFICGFSFGKHLWAEHINKVSNSQCNPMAISGGRSWTNDNEFRAYSVVNSPSYIYKTNEEDANRFKVKLLEGTVELKTYTERENDRVANGKIHQVIWLEKGDAIELIDITRLKSDFNISWIEQFIRNHAVNFDIGIEPFRSDKEWITVSDRGEGTADMQWNDPANIKKGELNLMPFLPSEVKINDWVDNFCKAFNLKLSNIDKDSFALDLRDSSIIKNTSQIIDLDSKTSINQLINQALNLPKRYELGFTIDQKEHGYIKDSTEEKRATGGGVFNTHSQEKSVINQTSNFSYTWYKNIKYKDSDKTLSIPVITDNEIWENEAKDDYAEMMKKNYFNKAQRFWYKKDTVELTVEPNKEATIALVSNTYQGDKKLYLNYEDKPDSIMHNYFTLLTNEKNYTIVECYLTPQEYDDLDKSLVKFNGDLYIVAEADSYDPMEVSKTKLKLIKRI